ncbi:hypothetical protein HMPREF2533_04259 [Bacteroides fragilis]|nr:hypothetical protein HMPREF2530_04259 [Bacteroides fragilis]KXU41147.1 hypothetical protein HMPREF2533_04259 [Bacteroides fragilis]
MTLSGGKGVPDHFLLFSFQTVFLYHRHLLLVKYIIIFINK